MAASIIAWATVVITVGGIILLGVMIARRNKKHPKKIEFTAEGFVLHGPLGDQTVRWSEIVSAGVSCHTRFIRGGGFRRKRFDWRGLDIETTSETVDIADSDLEGIDFDGFLSLLQTRPRESNPQFKGVTGDLEQLRKSIPRPEALPPEEVEDEELTERIERRFAAMGRPVTSAERMAIIREEEKR